MIRRKRIKYVNTNRLKSKKCYNNSKNISNEYNYKMKQCKNNIIIKKLLYLIIIFPFITFFSFQMISIVPINKKQIIFSFGNYYIGQKILLKDNIEYYCIENCTSENRTFKLLKVDPLDINNDYKIDDNDKLAFDVSKSNIYNTSNKDNIGFYLEKLNSENNLVNTESIRLLTSEEYVTIRDSMNFGYDWDNGNWLANDFLGFWWLETPIVKSVYTVTPRGTYKLCSPNEKNYIRPVVVTCKDNVK